MDRWGGGATVYGYECAGNHWSHPKANIAFIFAENQEQVDKLLGLMPQCPSLRRVFYDDELGMRHYRQSPLLSYAALMEQGRTHLAEIGAQLEGELERGSGKDPAALFLHQEPQAPRWA